MRWGIETERIPRIAVLLSSGAVLVTALPHFLAGVSSPDKYAIFYRLFYFNDALGSLAMLLALLLALALPGAQDFMVRLATWMGENPGKVVAVAFVCLALGAHFIYLRHPFSMDESTPVMQAHAFAQGQLAAHYPPALLDAIIPRWFQGFFIIVDRQTGEAISAYWPGLALLQTPFVYLGLDWCLNPALGALTLFMMHRLAGDATGQSAAGGWAMLTALASPQFTVSAMSYYAMPGELALNLLYLWLLLRPGWKNACAAGLVGGLALIMHNPVPHALMALPCLLWLAWRQERWGRLVAVLLGYVPLGLGVGLGWWLYENHFGDGHTALLGTSHQGLIASVTTALKEILIIPTGHMLLARWYAVWKTWIWACPGLLLVLLISRQLSTRERLLIATMVLTFVFYLFVPFDQGHGWGYRYIHPVWGALPIAAGLWLASANHDTRRWGGTMALAGLLATPAFLWQTQATIKHELSYRLTPPETGNWIVFVAQDSGGGYKGDLVQNPPGQYHTHYLVSTDEEKDRALMALHFPGAEKVQQDYRGSIWRVPQDVTTWPHQASKSP